MTNLVTKRDYTLAMAIERATKLGENIEGLRWACQKSRMKETHYTQKRPIDIGIPQLEEDRLRARAPRDAQVRYACQRSHVKEPYDTQKRPANRCISHYSIPHPKDTC